jgi:hypothetical protein
VPSSATTAHPQTLVGHDCGDGSEVVDVDATAEVDGADVEVSLPDTDVDGATVADAEADVVDVVDALDVVAVVDDDVLVATADVVGDVDVVGAVVTDEDDAGAVVVVVSSAETTPEMPPTATSTAPMPATTRRHHTWYDTSLMLGPDRKLHRRETAGRFPTIRRGNPC